MGRALFSEMINRVDTLPGLRAVQLSVVASMRAAITLYEKFGFAIQGVESEALCVDGIFRTEYHMVRKVGTAGAAETGDPAAVVQRQLDAFNARDVEAMARTYAEDAEQLEHPSRLLAKGVAQLREGWTQRFRDERLHATLLRRTIIGTTVVDCETVTRTYDGRPGTADVVGIYETKGGKIARAWFVLGKPVMHDREPN